MRALVLSDLHLEFSHFEAPQVDADIVILAGDISTKLRGVRWAAESFKETPVLYVPGNHEYYGGAIPQFDDKLRSAAVGSSVHVLQNDSATIEGVKFLGTTLWTDLNLLNDSFRAAEAAAEAMSDFRLIRLGRSYRRLRPGDTVRFHASAKRWLEAELRVASCPTVVVTHHAPSGQSLNPLYRGDALGPAFASEMTDFIRRLAPELWIHGHCHYPVDYSVGETRVLSNARGYPEERLPGFRPDLTVDIGP